MEIPVLHAEALSVGYGSKIVVKDINMALVKGKVAVLIGKNGVGKSTLLRTVVGELPQLSGHIRILGNEISKLSRKTLATMVAVVSTENVNAGGLTVEELVSLGRQPYTGFFGRLSGDDHKIVVDAMRDVGIYHKRGAFISDLSDGERQKAMIARALAQKTPLLVLDEPLSFLDVAARVHILLLLKKIAVRNDMAVILSSHDVAQALRMADCLFILNKRREFIATIPQEAVEKGYINDIFDSSDVSFSRELLDFVACNNYS